MCDWGNCEDCIHARFMKGKCRGVMDCDPDEYWCEKDNDYFCGEREYDEDGEELECEDYSRGYDYEAYKDDEGDRKYDEWRDEHYGEDI